jgi:hypothetical protein
MTTPFIYITTHRIDPEHRAELDALTTEYTDYLRANEEDLLAHYSYRDETGCELSLVQIHRDAESAERHLKLAGPLIHRGVTLAPTLRIQVYGEPGPAVRQALQANVEAGAQVVVAATTGPGFARVGGSA